MISRSVKTWKLAKKGINSVFGSWAKHIHTHHKKLNHPAMYRTRPSDLQIYRMDRQPQRWANRPGLELQAVGTEPEPTHIPHDSFIQILE
eukprot:1088283-Pelagomonas_calceolata.AAC.1